MKTTTKFCNTSWEHNMGEALGYIFLGLAGFLIGGLIGVEWYEGFKPYCWIGLCIAWGIPVAAQAGCDNGD